jgi:hypothetical protein
MALAACMIDRQSNAQMLAKPSGGTSAIKGE